MTILRPGCKINLGLRVTGREPNGYHSLTTFFYPLKYPADELRICTGQTGELEISCANPELDGDKNLLRKAWNAFGKATGIWRPYAIVLKKRIPVGSGLGGGSADAAAFLSFLNQEACRPLDDSTLGQIAFSLGADVPFFLLNRPCVAGGAGEKLVPTPFHAADRWLVLVSPDLHAGTAQVFQRWDELNTGAPGMVACRERGPGNQGAMAHQLFQYGETRLTKNGVPASKTNSASDMDLANDLEIAAVSLWPALARLKDALLELGAEEAAMSGSGASFYGIFAGRQSARFAAAQLRSQWPRVYCLQLRDFGM